jgi:hypothetical protein
MMSQTVKLLKKLMTASMLTNAVKMTSSIIQSIYLLNTRILQLSLRTHVMKQKVPNKKSYKTLKITSFAKYANVRLAAGIAVKQKRQIFTTLGKGSK